MAWFVFGGTGTGTGMSMASRTIRGTSRKTSNTTRINTDTRPSARRGGEEYPIRQVIQQPHQNPTGGNVKLGAAIVGGLAVALYIYKATRKRGSVERLVSRGMLDEDREAEDPYYKNIMKNVNKVRIESLSDEQIEAARKRRAGERASTRTIPDKLEEFDIPENHPWAEKKELPEGDEELIKARLEVKRGLPLQSLTGEDDQT